jgi:hypothetical protein
MGVEFTVEILDKIDAAVRASKELENVSKAAKHADEATRKAEKSMGALGKAISGAGGMVREFGAHLAALATWDAVKSGIHFVTELGKSAFEAAAGAQRLEKSFGFMFGKERGDQLLEQADKTAKVSQFSDDLHKQATQSLLASGFKGDDRLMVLRSAAADIAGKTGTKEGGFLGAISMFQQMQTTNAAPMARALKDMGLGEGAGKAIEKEMGRGLNAVDAFLTVLQKSNQGKPFGAIDEEMAKLADVRWRKLMDLPGQYFQQLSKTAAFDQLSEKLGKILGAFDPDSPRGQKIFRGIEVVATKITAMLERIDVDKVATKLLLMLERLPGLIEATTAALLGLAKVVGHLTGLTGEGLEAKVAKQAAGQAVAPVFDDRSATERFLGVPGSIKADLRLGGLRGPRVPAQPNWLDRMLGITQEGLDRARANEAREDAERLGMAVPKGVAKGIAAAAPAAVQQTWTMMDDVTEAGKGALKIRSPSRVFAEMGAYSALGFVAGIDAAMPDVAASMSQFSPEALVPDLMVGPRATPVGVSAAVGGAGARVEANIAVYVTAGGSGGEAGAREVGQAAAEGARQAVQSLLEQMQAEGG